MAVRYPLDLEAVQKAALRAYEDDDLCGGRVPGFEVALERPRVSVTEIGQRSCPRRLTVEPLSAMANDTYDELIEEAITPSVKLTGQHLLNGAELQFTTFAEWDFIQLATTLGMPTACVVAWNRKASGDIRLLDDIPPQVKVLASHAVQWDQVLWVQGGHGRFHYNHEPAIKQEGSTTTVEFPVSVLRLTSPGAPRANLVTISNSLSLSLPSAVRHQFR